MIFAPEYLVSRISCATDSIDNVSNGSLFRTLELIADTQCVLTDRSQLFSWMITLCLMWVPFAVWASSFPKGFCVSSGFMGNGSARRATFFGVFFLCKHNTPIFLNQHQEAFYFTSGFRRRETVEGGKKQKKKPNLWKIRNHVLNGKHNIGYVMSLILFKAIIWLREQLYKTVISFFFLIKIRGKRINWLALTETTRPIGCLVDVIL